MCAVSMVHDAFQRIEPQQWTWPLFNDYRDLIRRLDDLERRMGVAECHDPAKAEWMLKVEDRLKQLERVTGPVDVGST